MRRGRRGGGVLVAAAVLALTAAGATLLPTLLPALPIVEAVLSARSAGVNLPEALDIGPEGALWFGSDDGQLYRWRPEDDDLEAVAKLGGLSIGLEYDATRRCFWSATYGVGIQRIDVHDGQPAQVSTVVPLSFPEDVLLLPEAGLLFTVGSETLTLETLPPDAPLIEWNLLDFNPSGSLWLLRPEAGELRRLASGLALPSGLAPAVDANAVLIVEVARYRVLRVPLDGSRPSVLTDDIPGIPDDIVRVTPDRWWVTLPAPRSRVLDVLQAAPPLAALFRRMPYRWQSALLAPPLDSGRLLALSGSGLQLGLVTFPGAPVSLLANAVSDQGVLRFGALAGQSLYSLDAVPDFADP